MSIPARLTLCLTLFVLLMLPGIPLLAQEMEAEDTIVLKEPEKPGFLHNLSTHYSYVLEADMDDGSGKLSEQAFGFAYSAQRKLDENWALRFGMDYDRMDFGGPKGSPLPNNLQDTFLHLGAEYTFSEKWSAFAMISPGMAMINGWDDIQSESFQVNGAIGGGYVFHKDLSLRFGLAFRSESDIPVFPILSLRWAFAEKWTLTLGVPKTSVEYQVLDNLRVFSELNLNGGSYRTSNTYGTSVGNPNLNDRKLNYREVRLGIGSEYDINKLLQLRTTVGGVVYRKFDFDDASYEPEVDPAPYAEISLRAKF